LGLAYAAGVWAADRWAGMWATPLLVVLTGALFAALYRVLGRVPGAVVAVLTASALSRYAVQIAGLSVRPEHLMAPLGVLALLPDRRALLRQLGWPGWLLMAWLAWSVVGSVNAPAPSNSLRWWLELLLAA